MPSNMPPGYSDDGDAPTSGRDTAIYQELAEISGRFNKWFATNVKYHQFGNKEQEQKAQIIESVIDDLLDDLAEPL